MKYWISLLMRRYERYMLNNSNQNANIATTMLIPYYKTVLFWVSYAAGQQLNI